MLKKIILGISMLSSVALAEVTVKILEPIRFKDLNTISIEADYLVGEGVFEVSTDNPKVDLGKKIVFRFPETGIMTNKKNTITVKKYSLPTKDDSMIISTEREQVKFYALIDRREIGRNKLPEIVEGEYVGYVPVVFSLYERIKKGGEN